MRQSTVLGLILMVAFAAFLGADSQARALGYAGVSTEPVLLKEPHLISKVETEFQNVIPTMAVKLGQNHLHWILDVRVNEYAELEEVNLLSIFRVIDTTAGEKDLACETQWGLNSGFWVRKQTGPLSQICHFVSGFHPARKWLQTRVAWFPHKGSVNRGQFKMIYDEFDKSLAQDQIFQPSWTRDSWMLSVAMDSELKTQKLWIFAGALLDRVDFHAEKRADCHGYVARNEAGDWAVEYNVQCRQQMYRYTKSCFDEREETCSWDWVPDGAL